jgi:hypothetical protein
MNLINCLVLTQNTSNHVHTQPQNKYLSPGYLRDRIILTPEEYTNIISFIKTIISQEKKELKLGKKVYLGSSSNLPRHKVKEYFNNNNTKKTSRFEQADSIIIDKGNIEKLLLHLTLADRTNYDDINLYKTYIVNDCKDKQNLLPTIIPYTHYEYKLEDLISDSITPFYILTLPNKNPIPPYLKSYLDNLTPQDLYVGNGWSINREVLNVYEAVVTLYKNPRINIVFDEDILPLINIDGLDLDPDYLSTLDSMFESKNQENINLALEMLSNVDLEKYTLTLALFLNKHMDKFFKGSGLNINQNRSFKSFIKYFEAKKINFRSNWKTFSANLLMYYKNDPQSTEIINSFIIQNINNYLKTVGQAVIPNPIEIKDCTIRLK